MIRDMGAITPDQAAHAAACKPLRKDAERNRQRILVAARELFAERGIGVTLDDIAAHAGVGVGTVYRRFDDRDALVDALFKERIDELVAEARRALSFDDPWDGLVHFLRAHLRMQHTDRSFATVVMSDIHGREAVEHAKLAIRPIVGELVGKAVDAGRVRADLETSDVPMIALMLSSVLNATRDLAPDVWERYLTIILDGIRPGSTTPLTVPGLTDDQIPEAMRCGLSQR